MKKTFLLIALMPALLFAQSSSEDFRITKQVLDAGGAPSSSADFRLVSAYGQPTPIGAQTSADFVLYAGFLNPTFAVSPLSPIQALVILQAQPDVILYWEPIAGANSYKIYRSLDPMFIPGPGDLIGMATDTTYTDVNATTLPNGKYFYNVTASTEGGSAIVNPPTPPPSRVSAAPQPERTPPRE
ncbi:MAG: hypothetical protein V1784_02640, partial [bacterium]